MLGESSMAPPLPRWLAFVQGVFYVATGLWPLFHMPSFLAVTGPKADLWLVQAFGLLIAAVGVVFLWAWLRRRIDPAVVLAGIVVPTTLAFSDAYFVAKGDIPPIYLADAVAEAALAAAWLVIFASRRVQRRHAVPFS